MSPNQTTAATGTDASMLDGPLPQLLDHIVKTYHAPLRADLLRLQQLIQQRLDASSVDERMILEEIERNFSALCDELELHMDKEEKVLFPWIRAGRGASAKAPIKVMLREHQQTEELLACLRSLGARYAPSVDGSAARSIAQGLAAIDESLQAHMRLEEHLFKRALVA
jgi:regulator of cell morphogenesis and NO signaling